MDKHNRDEIMFKQLKYELEKEIVISDNNGFTLLKLNNKQIGILLGLISYLLLFQSASLILTSPIHGIVGLIYAFLICLPTCYLQMKKHRDIEQFIYPD